MKSHFGITVCLALYSMVLPMAYPQAAKTCAQPTSATDEKFAPGQVWSFKARPFEPNATVTVLKIESLPKIGEVIHVRLEGIQLRNCGGSPEPNQIQHAPFTKEALNASVIQLIRTGVIPEFEDGYFSWLSHCGGVYTIPLSQMLTVDEKTFSSRSNCTL